MKNNLVIGLVVVLVGAGAFWGGMTYAQGQTGANRLGNFQGRNGQFAGGPGAMMGGQLGQNRGGGNLATGEILSKDDKSLTLKLRNGGSMVVFFSATTNLSKSVDATQNDLVTGKTVVVGGKTNTDGTITAQTIQLRDLPSPVTDANPTSGSANVQPSGTATNGAIQK